MEKDTMMLLQQMTNLPLVAMVIARISGFVTFVPFFNSSQVPVKTRALLAGVISLTVLPFVAPSLSVPGDLGGLVLVLIGELLIGLTFGLMISGVFAGLELAGLLIGQQVGVAMAQVFDPMFGQDSSVLGQLYFWLALIIFLLIRGHMILLSALINSFNTMPPGEYVIDAAVVAGLVGILRLAFIMALQVSAPIIVAIFLTTLALGFVGRTVPQLNILSVGFSLRLVLGFVLITVCIVPALQVFVNALEEALGSLYKLINF